MRLGKVKMGCKVVLVVLILCGMVGCVTPGGMKIPTTLEERIVAYVAARMEFNDTMKDYLVYKQMMTPEKQADLSAKVKPVAKTVDDALDAWGEAIDAGQLGLPERETWASHMKTFVNLLMTLNVIEVKE